MHLKIESLAINGVLGSRMEVELDTEEALRAPEVVGCVAGGEVPIIRLNTTSFNVIVDVDSTFIVRPLHLGR